MTPVLAAMFFLMSALGVAFGYCVLRADSRRWDNVVFASMTFLDAGTTAYRGLALLGGSSLTDIAVQHNCAATAFVMAWWSIEFAYSFPMSKPAPWSLRAPVVVWVGATLVLDRLDATRAFVLHYSEYFLFIPAFLLIVAFQARNFRRVSGNRSGVAIVMGALVFRWIIPVVTYSLVWSVWRAAFPAFNFFNATAAVLVSYLLIAPAVLRNQLFSVRGVAADVTTYLTGAVAIVALTALAVEAALRQAGGPVTLRASLVLAALIPVLAFAIGVRIRGRMRDAKREAVVARVASSEPDAMLRDIRGALAELSRGAELRYLRARGPLAGDELPATLRERLERGAYVHRDLTPDLTAAAREGLKSDLYVAVRTASALFGALAIKGGRVDRETLLAAVALADRLALKLENYALFAELETSRRLATLGAFAAGIAHDIRTPLTSVKMNVQILRGKALKKDPIGDDDMEYFDIALEELERLNANIGELLDYAKPITVHRAAVDLRDVVEDASRAVLPRLIERQLKLDKRFASELPAIVGDAQRLRQVIVNLLENAANASNPGKAITIATRAADAEKVAIDVIDEGTGIERADLERIFEPFFTRRADGTGLGLAICQKVVRAHEGEIRVRSAPGNGSTFTVLLPLEHGTLPA